MDIMDSRIEAYMKQIPVLAEAAAGKEVFWVNSRECPESGQGEKAVSKEQIQDAARRLERFAPYLAEVFPEPCCHVLHRHCPIRPIGYIKVLI